MLEQNLYFNILTFDWPKKPVSFYFSLVDVEFCSRIHRTLFPKNIESIFPGVTTNGTEFIYTNFAFEKEGFVPLAIDFPSENPDLIKKYYNRQINYYLRKIKKQIVRTGFINENQVWIHSKIFSTTEYAVYQKFSLRTQISTVSKFPELLLSYDGKSRVYSKNVTETLKQVSPSLFNRVLVEKKLVEYEDFIKEENPDYDNAFPVLNKRLSDALGFESEEIIKDNRYLKYNLVNQ